MLEMSLSSLRENLIQKLLGETCISSEEMQEVGYIHDGLGPIRQADLLRLTRLKEFFARGELLCLLNRHSNVHEEFSCILYNSWVEHLSFCLPNVTLFFGSHERLRFVHDDLNELTGDKQPFQMRFCLKLGWYSLSLLELVVNVANLDHETGNHSENYRLEKSWSIGL